jgi:hypothetical protein
MALGANRLELTAKRPMGRRPSLTEQLTAALIQLVGVLGAAQQDRVDVA